MVRKNPSTPPSEIETVPNPIEAESARPIADQIGIHRPDMPSEPYTHPKVPIPCSRRRTTRRTEAREVCAMRRAPRRPPWTRWSATSSPIRTRVAQAVPLRVPQMPNEATEFARVV